MFEIANVAILATLLESLYPVKENNGEILYSIYKKSFHFCYTTIRIGIAGVLLILMLDANWNCWLGY